MVNYVPGTGPLPLYPEANLELCEGDRVKDLEEEDASCSINTIRATVELETTHIGKGCDRDTYRWERTLGGNQVHYIHIRIFLQLVQPAPSLRGQRGGGGHVVGRRTR